MKSTVVIVVLACFVSCSRNSYVFESTRSNNGMYFQVVVNSLDGSPETVAVSLVDPARPHPLLLWNLVGRTPLSLWIGIDKNTTQSSMLICNEDGVSSVEHLAQTSIESLVPINGDFTVADKALLEGIMKRFAKHKSGLPAMNARDLMDWFCSVDGRRAFYGEIGPAGGAPILLHSVD
jgi:hypothetical protein